MNNSRWSKTFSVISVGFLALVSAVAVRAQVVVAPPVPLPPPPALNQIVVPDINRLGLLDCQGTGKTAGGTARDPAQVGGMANCTQYTGFPVTKPAQRDALVALGKALFWDMRVGSDGVTACATCHFHAGADSRAVNQMSPGLNRVDVNASQFVINAALNPNDLTTAIGINADLSFNGSNSPAANGVLLHSHFPRLSDIRSSAGPEYGNNDVTSSQGVVKGTFSNQDSTTRIDNGVFAGNAGDLPFQVGSFQTRRVEPRNTPTSIGAGYNLRNFWDGRANMFFNGVNPFGMLDVRARVTVYDSAGKASPIQFQAPYSSLASQAVGPPGSPFEMSHDGRNLQNIAQKLLVNLPDVPLDGQKVAPTDSVLGPYACTGQAITGCEISGGGYRNTGLKKSYKQLINEVFQAKFTNNTSDQKTNFALFFGLAVQAYEATLVPDQTPLDPILAFMTPLRQQAVPLTADQQLTAAFNAQTIPGSNLSLPERQQLINELRLFLNPIVAAPAPQTGAACVACHVGAEFTGATVSTLTGFGRPAIAPVAAPAGPGAVAIIERMTMGNGTQAVYDSGFYNIGVRPTADDLSIFGRVDFNGPAAGDLPFSIGMLKKEILLGNNPAANEVAALLRSGALKQPAAAVGYPNFTVDLTPVALTAFPVGCAPPAPNAQAAGQLAGQGCTDLKTNEPIAVRGAFKTSTLRNVKFMGPFLHNGGRESVRDVIAGHYNPGGIFNMAFNPQNCGVKPNGTSATTTCFLGQVDFDPGIVALRINGTQIDQLTHLIEFGLTDPRVATEQGPFDHPQLCVPLGHDPATGKTLLAEVTEVGTNGNAQELQTFTDAINGADKAHKLVAGTCTMTLP